MSLGGRVIAGEFVNASISINRKGELALTSGGFKRTPNITADSIATWEEVPVDKRRGKTAAIGKVGSAVAKAAIPGPLGKAAAAAVDSTVSSVGSATRHVRVDWNDGAQSLLSLPDDLFLHLRTMLADKRVGGDIEPSPEVPAQETKSGFGDHLSKLVTPVLGENPPDVMEQIAKLAELRNQGVLTEEEFVSKKTDLLNRL